VERPVRLADPDIAGVDTAWDCSERELRGELGGEVFERVDREVDATLFEGFFDLFDEDAFAVEVGGWDEAGLLHSVAGGANDLELDVISGVAKGVEDVVGLPEGELRSSAADANWVVGVVVLAAHLLQDTAAQARVGRPKLPRTKKIRSVADCLAD